MYLQTVNPFMDDTTPSVGEVAGEQVSGDTPQVTADQDHGTPEAVDITSIDPSTLAPELVPIYKSMQADYTKKTQDIASVRDRAEAFEELIGHPELARAIENLEKFGTITAPAAPTGEQLTEEEKALQLLSDPDTYIGKLVEERARELIQPLTEREAQREADSTYQQMTQKYDDFAELSDEITTKIKSSGYKMDVEDAYKAVAYEKALQRGVAIGAKATQDRVNAATAKGSTATVISSKVFKTMAESFQAAKKEHGL